MQEVARLISVLLSVYSMLIIVRILMQWFNPARGYSRSGGLTDMLAKIVDPFLGLFKRISFLRQGALDFTPLAALMVINTIQRIFQSYAYSGTFSLGFTLATIVQSLWWSIGSLLLGILAILIGVRIYLSYRRSPNSIQYIAMLDSWLRRPLDFVQSLIFSKRAVSDRMLLWTALAAVAACYIGCAMLVNLLVQLLSSIPF
jgi:YggT family protein